MDYKTLKRRVLWQYEKKLPFVIFSLPDSEVIKGYFQNSDKLHIGAGFNTNGFILSPFDDSLKNILIPQKGSDNYQAAIRISEIERKQVVVAASENERVFYEQLVQKTIETIQNGPAQKIVVSRKKDFTLNDFSIESLVERLFSAYPSAYRYVWYHRKTGIWCGATPETLVDIKKNNFKTMALAGTQPYTDGQIVWRQKELEEQYFVTEAILKNLKGIVEEVQISETQSHRAGNLLHLRTNISGKLPQMQGALLKIANALHPTPAVCGTPREVAKEFILKNEGYPREYYTGFVGSIDDDGTSATLMVNLRCMKIENGKASIYVGGGITTDSDPKEEWEETQNKMQTMLQVLHPML